MKMLKWYFVYSIFITGVLLGLFFIFDNLPISNGGNGIFFSFPQIVSGYVFCLMALILFIRYMVNYYFKPFVSLFIPCYLVINLVVGYKTSFDISCRTLVKFLESMFARTCLASIITMVTIILINYQQYKSADLTIKDQGLA